MMTTGSHSPSALVSGGSRGIGRAIVDRLVADGYTVTSCGRGERPDDLDDTVNWVRGDVADPGDAVAIFESARAYGGGLELLVNNAGVQVERTLLESSDADWEQIVGINCRGVFNLCRAALGLMSERGGVIVNIGSISGEVSDPSMALYNASKAFVHALTRSIAVDHGPQVRCNTIQPGWILTEMVDAAFDLAQDPEAAKRDAIARHPSGRLGNPADIAAAVAWLASPEAAFVTGQSLRVDGGLTAASPLRPQLS